jgi:hypothetical protein
MFSAATLTIINTREAMINQLQAYASPNLNNTPYAVVYNPTNGQSGFNPNSGMNSPAQGAVFSLLALT